MTDDEIPASVREKVLRYRDALWAGRAAYERQRRAAVHGDAATVELLEKGRPDRNLATDRARVELDEAVRLWA